MDILNALKSELRKYRCQKNKELKKGTVNDSAVKPQQRFWLGVECQYGKNSYFGNPVRVFNPFTRIGAFCSIAWDVNIGTTTHPQGWLSTHIFQYSNRPDLYDIVVEKPYSKEFEFSKPVIIGNDVWIGCDVTILDGVNIGDGAIIGAGSIVNKDIPPYAIAVGVPARVVKYRFNEEIIRELLELRWWELDDDIINKLPFDNVHSCLHILKDIRKVK